MSTWYALPCPPGDFVCNYCPAAFSSPPPRFPGRSPPPSPLPPLHCRHRRSHPRHLNAADNERRKQGWNQIQFNLSDFTRRAYGTNYIETLRVQIHANCRIRRIYFSDRLYSEEELPPEFKLFLPITKQEGQGQQAPMAAT